jgi:exosome complex RNA-binding protein Csl4
MAKCEIVLDLLSEHLSWVTRETGRQRHSRPIDYKVSESSSGKVKEQADGTRVGNIVRGPLASLFGDLAERVLEGLNA